MRRRKPAVETMMQTPNQSFVRRNLSVQPMMVHVCWGLLPCLAAAVYFFGIRCLAVCPGLVETPLVAVDPEQGLAKGGIDDAMREWFMARTPSRRFATPEDVAGAVVMLCADQASYVNGTHLLIDGGLVQG